MSTRNSIPPPDGHAIARNTIINFAGQIAPLLAAIISIPFILKGIGTDRFGILNLVWVIVGYFSLFDLGLGRALTVIVASRYGGDEGQVAQTAWAAIFLMFLLGLIGAILMIFLAPWLVEHLFNIPPALHGETLNAFYLLGVSVPIVIVSAGLRGILEGLNQFWLLNVVKTPLGIFTYASPLLVLPFSSSLLPIVILILVGRLLSLMAFFYLCWRLMPRTTLGGIRPFLQIPELVRLGGWMTVSNIVGPVMVYMDRFLIASVVSASAVAYYATPYEVVTKLWVIPVALTGVLFPLFATNSVHAAERNKRIFQSAIKFTFIAIYPLTLILVAAAPEGLSLWLGESFSHNSYEVMRWLAVGVLMNCIAQIPQALLQGTGRPDISAKLHLFELVIYLPSVIWMTIEYGIVGTAIAWDIRILLDIVLLFWMTKKELGMLPFDVKSALIMFPWLFLLMLAAMPIPLPVRAAIVLLATFAFAWVSWRYLLVSTERDSLTRLMKR